jgi:NAD(P)-dependent dehydrogenase (short-subunit alcohol dehydrogenase family)
VSRRRVVVTGAHGAIGRATADAFAGEGWHVIGVDRIEAAPGSCDEFLTVDLADPAAAGVLGDHLTTGGGRLDALVNNAAIQIDRPLLETSDDEWRSVMNINLDAAFRLVRTLYPCLATARGAVVNVSSIHAITTSPNVAAYAVSKAALVGLTRTAALELAADGIRCNAVLPGAVRTPMLISGLSRRPHPDGADGNLRDLIARTPLGMVAEPHQIAPSIVFLADGDRSPYTTGQVLVVDGGATIRLGTE